MSRPADVVLRTPYKPIFQSGNGVIPPGPITSARLGGDVLYLFPDEDWPVCPTCAHPLVPLIQIDLSASSTPAEFTARFQTRGVLQLLACPAVEHVQCFQDALVNGRCSWLLRISDFPPQEWEHVPSLASLAAAALDCTDEQTSIPNLPQHLTSIISRARVLDRRAGIRADLRKDDSFRPSHFVTRWTLGKPEMIDYEDYDGSDDVSEEVYQEWGPSEGLKLLGYEVKGKFKCGDWTNGCPKETPGCQWRCLVQLGSGSSSYDEGLELVETVGNCWIMQCEQHREILDLGMSGNW